MFWVSDHPPGAVGLESATGEGGRRLGLRNDSSSVQVTQLFQKNNNNA